MTIEFSCENCGKPFQIDASYAGKKCKCRQCGHIFLVPAPRPSSSAPPRKLQTFGEPEPVLAPAPPPRSRPAPPPPPRREPLKPAYSYDDDTDDPYGLEELAPLKPLFPEDEDELSPPRAPIRTASRPRKKKSRDRTGDVVGFFSGLPGLYYAIVFGLLGLAFVTAFVNAQVGIAGMVFVGVIGAAVPICYGGIGLTIVPFFESAVCGLLNMFVPFYQLYYLITRWDAMRGPFLSYLSGIGIVIVMFAAIAPIGYSIAADQQPARPPRFQARRMPPPMPLESDEVENDAEARDPGPTTKAPDAPGPVGGRFLEPPVRPNRFGPRFPGPPRFGPGPPRVPVPPAISPPRGFGRLSEPPANPDEVVTLRVSGLLDDETRNVFDERLREAHDGPYRGVGGGGRMTYTVWPVDDVEAFARAITWAKVSRIVGRTIDVEMTPVGGGQPRALARARPRGGDLVSTLLLDLKSPSRQTRKEALAKVIRNPPDPARRVEVAKAVETMLEDPDGFTRSDAAKALGVWGGPENIPALVSALDDSAFNVVWAVLDALALLKDPACAEAVAARLAENRDRGKAIEVLRAIGPKAESAVIPYLESGDWVVRMESCKLLQSIGGEASVGPLQELLRRTNGHGIDAMAAREALRHLNAPEIPASPRKKADSSRRT